MNSVTFLGDSGRMVSSSDDKSIRLWDWDVPVDNKYIAEPGMHSMPYAAVHPNSTSHCQSIILSFELECHY